MTNENIYLESKPRYEILDGLRGVASLLVIIFHIGETSCVPGEQQWLNHGYLAVDFFFAIILAWGVFKAFDEPARQWLTDNWLKGERKLPMWLKVTAGLLVAAAVALIIFKP